MKPTCHNHHPYRDELISAQFPLVYEFRMSRGCPHWLPGGNAHVRKMGDGPSGKRFEWSTCEGCRWKLGEYK